MPSLLTTTRIDEQPSALVKRTGQVLHTFDHLTQDSGNVSWIVRIRGTRLGENLGDFSGGPYRAEVVEAATCPDRGRRPATVAALQKGWEAAGRCRL